MSVTIEEVGNRFSREAVRKAVADEPISDERQVQLNELAAQVAEQFAAGSVSPRVLAGFVAFFEFLGITAAGIGLFLYHFWPEHSILSWYVSGSFLGALLTVGFTQGMDGYMVSSMRGFVAQFCKATTAFAMAAIVLGATTFLTNGLSQSAIQWFGSWFGLTLVCLLISRICVAGIVSRLTAAGRLERRAVIVGGGQTAADLINSMESNQDSDIRICGIFDDRTDERSPPIVAGYPKLGTVRELVEFARKARINMLIVAIPFTAEKRVLQLLKRLWILPVDIRLSSHANKLFFRPRSYSYEGAVPFVDVFETPIADWDSVMKRIFDVFFASVAIVLLSPLMLATAFAVKLDSRGPVFFKQKRQGFNNELIEVWKFRSLHTDLEDKSGVDAVTKNDKRVTRVGRIIRKTSIDELPQLFNVLAGSLSLVGPRPHVANARTGDKLWTETVDSYFARHRVKPGVTGWAQINGWRGEVDSEEKLKGRVEHDLYYIENWSVVFDLYILALTPFRLVNTENAY